MKRKQIRFAPSLSIGTRQIWTTIGERLLKLFNGIGDVKFTSRALPWFIRVSRVLVGRRTKANSLLTLSFLRWLNSFTRSGSKKFSVLYLKASQVLLMQSIVGSRIKDTKELKVRVARTKSGLPRCIPVSARRQIRNGNRTAIRVWNTYLGLYRIIEFPGKVTLKTITAPGVLLSTRLLVTWETMIKAVMSAKTPSWGSLAAEVYKISASSPTSTNWYKPIIDGLRFKDYKLFKSDWVTPDGISFVSTSLSGIIRGAFSLVNSEVFPSFEKVAMMIPKGDVLLEYLFAWTEETFPTWDRELPLGKLGFKEEAAGKIRVFAMVECWTQWLLAPLHKAIAQWISTLPMDGTFDQFAPIELLLQKGHKRFWCYDLSAATDRLPITLQMPIVQAFLGMDSSASQAWKDLLVGRPYLAKNRSLDLDAEVHYSVGQPMGAKSSWPMLAITHHLLVQLSAVRAGVVAIWQLRNGRFFSDYAVLGDDIVIANGLVAREYTRLMDEIGVGIGFAKSLVSKGKKTFGLEFAKKFIVDGDNCSMFSFKEFVAGRQSYSDFAQTIEKYNLSPSTIADLAGYGYKSRGGVDRKFEKLPRRLRSLFIALTSPGSPWSRGLIPWIASESLVSVEMRANWLAVLYELLPRRQNQLTDKLERLINRWRSFAAVLGHKDFPSDERELPTNGLVLDWINSDYFPEWVGALEGLSGGLRSQVAVALYYQPMVDSYNVLRELEKELTWIYEWSVSGPFTGGVDEYLRVIDDIWMHFDVIEETLSNLYIPNQVEFYPSPKKGRELIRCISIRAQLRSKLKAPYRNIVLGPGSDMKSLILNPQKAIVSL